MIGRPRSAQHRQRLSEAKRGKFSDAQRASKLRSVLRGPDNPAYNGGLWIEKRSGRCYIRLRNGHPCPYYRAVMEAHLRRPLEATEIVHHINGDPSDDRLENLALLPWGEHSSVSNKQYTQEMLIGHIQRFHEKHGRAPQLKDMSRKAGYAAHGTYHRYFGSWTNALREAGLA